jgi:hypothetical protein
MISEIKYISAAKIGKIWEFNMGAGKYDLYIREIDPNKKTIIIAILKHQ